MGANRDLDQDGKCHFVWVGKRLTCESVVQTPDLPLLIFFHETSVYLSRRN